METPNFESDAPRRYWQAAVKLHYRGAEVTVNRVREITGGSNRDITPVIKRFKDHQAQIADLQITELPPELDETVRRTFSTIALQVWEAARELANADAVEAKADKASAEAELESIKKELAKLTIDLEDKIRATKLAHEELQSLKTNHESLKTENVELRADLKAERNTSQSKDDLLEFLDRSSRKSHEEVSELSASNVLLREQNRQLRIDLEASKTKNAGFEEIIKQHKQAKLAHDKVVENLEARLANKARLVLQLEEELKKKLEEVSLSTSNENGRNTPNRGLRRIQKRFTPKRLTANSLGADHPSF